MDLRGLLAYLGPPLTKNEKAALEELIWEMTKPHTQEEIAKRLGVSQKTVHKIESRALKKLRELTSEDWQDGLRDAESNDSTGIKFR